MRNRSVFILSCVLFILLSGLWFLSNNLSHAPSFSIKANIGYHLFYDHHISVNQSRSCASCHDPSMAFTDAYRSSVSTLGENLLHNAPSLLNTSKLKVYDWANPNVTSLEKQMERPLFSHTPVELGLDQQEDAFYTYLRKDSLYSSLIALAFPDKQAFGRKELIACLTAFEKTLVSVNAPYDQWVRNTSKPLNASAQHGMTLFFSDALKCSRCHGGNLFTNAALYDHPDSIYFNIGLYNIANSNSYPEKDPGIASCTKQAKDNGKFKVPSLRNVALTAPYMHDGSVGSLEEVIDIYARGGRQITNGPLAGDGRHNVNKHPFIQGFSLSEQDKKDLISFLYALTDTSFLQHPFAHYPTYFKERK